ncbi:MAG: flagellar FlbD family protein [Tissierellia bacterium]|nr:flagellar FlbD family protein [Tissierellia bacterium]
MIKVTRFQGKQYYLNSELIMSIEETPDTVITLINGVKIVVKEDMDEVVERIKNFRKEINYPSTITKMD